METAQKRKLLIVQYFCFTILFFVIGLIAHFQYDSVASISETPVEPDNETQQDITCQNNFFVYRDCRDNRYDTLAIQPRKDQEYSERVLLLLFVGFVATCPTWGYDISSFKEAKSAITVEDDRFAQWFALFYPFLFAGIWAVMVYTPLQQLDKAGILLPKPGMQEYGPKHFNETALSFALVNHPPNEFNRSRSKLFESMLGKNQRVVAFMSLQELRARCPSNWIEKQCNLGNRNAVCNALIEVNHQDCHGTQLYLRWQMFWLSIKYVIPILIATELFVAFLFVSKCSYSRCGRMRCWRTSDASSRGRHTEANVPSISSRSDPQLAYQLQYFFSLHPPRDSSTEHRESNRSLYLFPLHPPGDGSSEYRRSNRSLPPAQWQRGHLQTRRNRFHNEPGNAESCGFPPVREPRRVIGNADFQECCICYENSAEFLCTNCNQPILCSRCRTRIYDHSASPAVYGRCPICRAFGSV